MAEMTFAAPDGGIWEQDATHFPRPVTRYLQEAFVEGFIKGFQAGTSCYGLMLDHIEPAFVNGFFYNKAVIVGAPPNAKGPPPKLMFKLVCLLHPAVRARLKRAAVVMEEKPWREHLKHWDTVLKPTSTANHLRLQSQDFASMSDAELANSRPALSSFGSDGGIDFERAIPAEAFLREIAKHELKIDVRERTKPAAKAKAPRGRASAKAARAPKRGGRKQPTAAKGRSRSKRRSA